MTGQIMNFDGFPILVPNDITIDEVDYYISYNNRDIGIYGCATTALVLTKPGKAEKFLILNGDHREAYKEIKNNGGSCKDCIDYFKANNDKKSKFSENWDEMFAMLEEGSFAYIKDASCVEVM